MNREEYMVSGLINGNPFREFFPDEQAAREYARKFRVWHKDDGCNWCKLSRCVITEIEE